MKPPTANTQRTTTPRSYKSAHNIALTLQSSHGCPNCISDKMNKQASEPRSNKIKKTRTPPRPVPAKPTQQTTPEQGKPAGIARRTDFTAPNNSMSTGPDDIE